jgi:hypothetical protein
LLTDVVVNRLASVREALGLAFDAGLAFPRRLGL